MESSDKKPKYDFSLRAWDTKTNVMHYDFEFMTVRDKNCLIFQSDIYEHDFAKWPPELEYEMAMIIMPDIRVNDKNGKLIFTHDFVHVITIDDCFTGVVVYSHGGCPIALDVNTEGKQRKLCYFDNLDAVFEVVGNLHENPEMKGKLTLINNGE